MAQWTHIPILAQEIKDLLLTKADGFYMDATLGLGGHAKYFLSFLGPQAKIYGYDKDAAAIKMAEERVNDARLITVNKSYTLADTVVDGALFDLGLSSYQLDDGTRGFSFMHDGPLDMRFDTSAKLTAQEVVNSYPFEDLERIFTEYGEEPNAAKIARAIVGARREARITTTKKLAEIISSASPRQGKLHPATNVFQAIRIEVNGEMKAVEDIGRVIERVINPGGMAAVITFHSLEDRVIKNIFKTLDKTGHWKLVNKKVIIPSYEETKHNPRSRSAKLRVIERVA